MQAAVNDGGTGGVKALAIRGLTKRYGLRRRPALRDATFDVSPGQVVAVVGPNGAGKSTLLRIIAGLDRSSSGSVAVNGIDLSVDRRRALSMVGFVAQESPVYRRLSVRDHLQMAGALRQNFDARAAVTRLEAAGIGLGTRGQELSGGQRAQLAITLALACRAAVLVMDEPLASLDPLARSELIESIRAAVVSDATSIVVSSHIITDVEPIADSVVILGAAHVLLASSVDAAVRSHRVSGDSAGEGTIGTYPSPDGKQLSLVRSSSTSLGRTPRLDDLVKGYLASARARGEADVS